MTTKASVARARPRRGEHFRAGKRLWTRSEDAKLRREYPHTSTKQLARKLRRTLSAVYGRVDKLGLAKDSDYQLRQLRCLGKRLQTSGAPHRYPKGHVPANKGLRRPGWAPGRMRETQFKKGEVSFKWKPVGATRTIDGYLYVKTSDIRNVTWRRNWRLVHVVLWEGRHGRIPARHALTFVNGDRADIRLENLELISRRELMARNTVHNLPKPLAEVIQLKGAVQRQINKRSRA